MTGVGGIFPNYEDHLLDKKKISECFSGNFHEMLCPLNYTSKECPLSMAVSFFSGWQIFHRFKYFDMEWKDKSYKQKGSQQSCYNSKSN